MASNKKSFGAKPWVYPQPVFLVGSYDINDRPNLMAVAWGGIVCSDPVSISISVRPARWTYEAIMARKAFTINIPDVSKIAEADYAGIVSGRRYDKFSTTGFTPVRAEKVDAPYVEECSVVLECTLAQTIEIGVHTLLIGTVEDVKVDEAVLDVTGSYPDLEKFLPLVYSSASGTYHGFGPVLGASFSIGKKLIEK